MPTEVKLWQIEEDTPIPVDPQDKVDYEDLLEYWLQQDIGLISDRLLVIGRQVPTSENHRIDLLAIDDKGNMVVLELKREMAKRESIAQALDYVSWVNEQSPQDIADITKNFFLKYHSKEDMTLEDAFNEKFGKDLPDLNQRRRIRIYVVAPSADSTTERIVGYLSEVHGMDINVATFAYFNVDGKGMIGRSMLLNEGVVASRAATGGRSKGTRPPPLTQDELREIAEENGVEELWDKAIEEFASLPQSRGRNRSRSSLYFNVRVDGSMGAFASLFPGHSSRENGLAISLSLGRILQAFSISEEDILLGCDLSESLALKDVGTAGWAYSFDADRLDKLIRLFRRED